eukprot:1698479-Rhodomonas_salina.1
MQCAADWNATHATQEQRIKTLHSASPNDSEPCAWHPSSRCVSYLCRVALAVGVALSHRVT